MRGGGGISVILSRVAAAGLGLLVAPLVAQALGPSGRGQTTAALAIVSLLPILSGFGLPPVVRRHAADEQRLGQTIRAVRVCAFAALVPGLLLGVALGALLLPAFDTTSWAAYLLGVGCAPLAVLWICDANALITQGRILAFAVVNVLPALANAIVVTLGWWCGALNVPFVIAANVVGTVLTVGVTSCLVRVSLRGRRSPLGPLLKDGMRFAGSQLAEAAAYRLDQAVALPVIGASQAGLYSVAVTIGLIPYALGQAIGAVSFKALLSEDAVLARRRAANTLRGALLGGILLCAALAAGVPLIVPLVFGQAFAQAVLPTECALLGSVAVVFGYVASSALTAFDLGWRMTVAQLAGLGSGILALLVLGPPFGALGAACASSIGYLVNAALAFTATSLGAAALLPRRGDVRRLWRLIVRGEV